jgi:hypothetical protein
VEREGHSANHPAHSISQAAGILNLEFCVYEAGADPGNNQMNEQFPMKCL